MASARKPARDEPCLQIGEVADRTGVTQRTLRFYEERGLLKPLQSLLGLTLAEIKDMVEAEEVREELNATYRPDRPVEERIERVQRRIEATRRQHDIISAKLTAMLEMKKDLEEKLQRYETSRAEMEKHRQEAQATS